MVKISKWGKYIDNISDKSNKPFGFLRRNRKYDLQLLTDQAYMAPVRSTMEYSTTIWEPYYQDIDKLHKVEKKAARFIANAYRYDTGSMT